MNRLRLITYILGGLLLSATLWLPFSPVQAQSPTTTLDWGTVDGGGTSATAGGNGYTLGGSIGQADAAVWSGGAYTLSGGFWPAAMRQTVDGTVRVYLPLVVKNYRPAPDLVITALHVTANNVSLTLKNLGEQPVTTEFWVDVYVDPAQPPTLNQPWQSIAPAGAAWGVTTVITAGETLELTTGDRYYFAEYSSDSFPVGVPVYGYIDSVDFNTTFGAVWERDEGNNRFGPITSAAERGENLRAINPSPAVDGLPSRQ